jgi:hypothetical protein
MLKSMIPKIEGGGGGADNLVHTPTYSMVFGGFPEKRHNPGAFDALQR